MGVGCGEQAGEEGVTVLFFDIFC